MYEKLANTLSTLRREHKLQREESLFVAEDRYLRGIAVENGFITVPHPLIASLLNSNQSVLFVALRGEEKNLALFRNIVPYFLRYLDNDQIAVLAVISDSDLARAITKKLSINILDLGLSV